MGVSTNPLTTEKHYDEALKNLFSEDFADTMGYFLLISL